jgi:hypothetical protein
MVCHEEEGEVVFSSLSALHELEDEYVTVVLLGGSV